MKKSNLLFFIIFSSISTNLIANYVPTQNVLLNLMPTKLNLKTSAIIIIFLHVTALDIFFTNGR